MRVSIAAVLWDMDGTLVDTEPYWMATEVAIAEQYGGTWTQEDAMSLVGNDLLVSGRYLKAKLDLPHTPEQVVEMLLDGVVARVRESVPWCPGARELLAALGEAGIPCALVTMSYQRFVDPILASLPEGTFAAVVTGDQVTAGKPDPEAYLKAAERLGVDPADCVAIEDSPTGARAALASGARTIAVPNHVPVPPQPGLLFRESLREVTVDELKTLPDRDTDTADLP